jgi:sugar lactone lactonase YvrE
MLAKRRLEPINCHLYFTIREGRIMDALLTVRNLAVGVAVLGAMASMGPVGRAATLYVSDHPTNGDFDTVRTFDGSTGASLSPNFVTLLGATGIALGPDGNLYVATTGNFTMGSGVLQYNATTGAPPAGVVYVNYEGLPPTPDPHDVIIPGGMTFGAGGRLYIADTGISNVHIYDGPGSATPGASVAELSGNLIQPTSVAVNGAGDLYVAGALNGGVDVWKYNSGSQTFTEGASPIGVGDLTNPIDLAFAPNGDLYVLDGQNFIKRFDGSGNYLGVVDDFSTSPFIPGGITFGPDGGLYVSGIDYSRSATGEVLRFNADGTNESLFVSGGLDNPTFLRFSANVTAVPLPSAALLGMTLLPAMAWARRWTRGRRGQ